MIIIITVVVIASIIITNITLSCHVSLQWRTTVLHNLQAIRHQ